MSSLLIRTEKTVKINIGEQARGCRDICYINAEFAIFVAINLLEELTKL